MTTFLRGLGTNIYIFLNFIGVPTLCQIFSFWHNPGGFWEAGVEQCHQPHGPTVEMGCKKTIYLKKR